MSSILQVVPKCATSSDCQRLVYNPGASQACKCTFREQGRATLRGTQARLIEGRKIEMFSIITYIIIYIYIIYTIDI